jgi:hypothetical protein
MLRSRRLRLAASFMIVAIGMSLSSCATGLAKAKPAKTQSAASTNAPSAPTSASSPEASKKPSAAAVDAAKSPASGLPEISFPYRKPVPELLIVASLHEPTPPAAKAAAPKAAASSPAPAVAAAPTQPGAAKSAAPAPKASAAPKTSAPKTTTPAPKASGKSEPKSKESEPKNAASSSALAVAVDPASGKKPDIPRNFSAVEGSRFEVPFDGTGWTYLGEQTNKEGIAYDSRRFEGTSLVFVLNPIKAGDYILRFQRQDSLRGLSYEELVGVTVAPKPAAGAVPTTSSAAVPASSAAVPAISAAVPAISAAVPTTSSAAVPANSAAVPANSAAVPSNSAVASISGTATPAPLVDASTLATPEAALLSARSELTAGRVPGALAALDRLVALAPAGTDEAFILYARALEQNGPQKDIKRAYAYYTKVRDEYPESPFWDEADARASYIERRYFDIR